MSAPAMLRSRVAVATIAMGLLALTASCTTTEMPRATNGVIAFIENDRIFPGRLGRRRPATDPFA